MSQRTAAEDATGSVRATGQAAVWKGIVEEASRALAHLDADRLEELAQCCVALNRQLPAALPADRAELLRQAHAAQPAMAVFERVLDATRANLRVIARLRALDMGCATEDDAPLAPWARKESAYGNH